MLKRRDLIAGIILIFFSIFFLYKAFLLPSNPTPGQPGPGLFPILILLGILLASLLLIYQEIKNTHRSKPIKINLKSMDIQKTLFIIIASIAYIILMEKVNFILITFLFLIVSMQTLKSATFLDVLMKFNKVPQIILISSLISLAIYFLFEAFLKIPLP